MYLLSLQFSQTAGSASRYHSPANIRATQGSGANAMMQPNMYNLYTPQSPFPATQSPGSYVGAPTTGPNVYQPAPPRQVITYVNPVQSPPSASPYMAMLPVS
jgi:hypothetical protein